MDRPLPAESDQRIADLERRRHWVFDLDATLTTPTQDFDVLRRDLGMPAAAPVLEWIAAQESHRATQLLEQVHRWERRHAERARAAPHALALLGHLRDLGHRLGIVTRNSQPLAMVTLQACGLSEFFESEEVIGREDAAAKPSPAGIERLLTRWAARPEDAVMVGDYRFDLEAARAAGVVAVWLDSERSGRFSSLADVTVHHLAALMTSWRS